MDKSKVCILVSGGVDSSVLLSEFTLRYKLVFPLYIRFGLLWEKEEIYWLKRFLNKTTYPSLRSLTILKLPIIDTYNYHWSTTGIQVPDATSSDEAVYLPGRNILLLSKSSVYCALHEIQTLAVGSLSGNPFPDASSNFFRTISRALSIGLKHQLQIITPFSHLTKEKVIKKGRSLPLELTFSCISPTSYLHCGRCNKCAERIKAFKKAGVVDRTEYKEEYKEEIP